MAFDATPDSPIPQGAKRLLQLAATLEGLPSEKYNHSNWGVAKRTIDTPCQTTACAFGWGAVKHGAEWGIKPVYYQVAHNFPDQLVMEIVPVESYKGTWVHVMNLAAMTFDLDDIDVYWIFGHSGREDADKSIERDEHGIDPDDHSREAVIRRLRAVAAEKIEAFAKENV